MRRPVARASDLRGQLLSRDINPASPGDSPVREVLRYYGVRGGMDNGDYETSEDRRNMSRWKGKAPAGEKVG